MKEKFNKMNPFNSKDEKKGPQETVWKVEQDVDKIKEDQKNMRENLSKILEHIESVDQLFLDLKAGQEEDMTYRTQTHEQLVDTVSSLKKEITNKDQKIFMLKHEKRSFWTLGKSSVLAYGCMFLSAMISAYLQSKFDNIYSVYFFWIAAFMALAGTILVIGRTLRKDD